MIDFDELFKNHQATRTDCGSLSIITYKKPESFENGLRYIFNNELSTLTITGDWLKAIVEFPVNDDEFVVSLRSSTQVKCTSGFTLSEHIAVPETTQLGSILKSGVKEARTALNKHNQ